MEKHQCIQNISFLMLNHFGLVCFFIRHTQETFIEADAMDHSILLVLGLLYIVNNYLAKLLRTQLKATLFK